MSRMLHGQTVTLIENVEVGRDAFNFPIYEHRETDIDNVLVTPVSSDDITSEIQLYTKQAIYQICVPKDDTHTWEDNQVIIYGKTWNVYTLPKEYQNDLVPLDWNRQYYIELNTG